GHQNHRHSRTVPYGRRSPNATTFDYNLINNATFFCNTVHDYVTIEPLFAALPGIKIIGIPGPSLMDDEVRAHVHTGAWPPYATATTSPKYAPSRRRPHWTVSPTVPSRSPPTAEARRTASRGIKIIGVADHPENQIDPSTAQSQSLGT
ncbi:hypothetical protein, partial [Fodinicola feengrottensis]|uniref:hypothetical protein n=1 Tax=Fodinicola feengrottensis TaxID=435914 RepID=UPI002440FE87